SLQALQQKVSRSDGPLAVVIVPTREVWGLTVTRGTSLVAKRWYCAPGLPCDHSVTLTVGSLRSGSFEAVHLDRPWSPDGRRERKSEKARLRKGINILVSTPGRLVDHIKNTLVIAFSSVRWLILDEADRILDLGFEKDLTVILNSLNTTGPSRQNVLLSATLSQGVTRLADVCLNDPVTINVSGPASSDLTAPATDPGSADQPESFTLPEALQQFVVVVPSKVRLVCLAAFILHKCKFSKNNKLIVFTSSCEAVEFLHAIFTAVLSTNQKPPLSFLRLHGNMKQEDRTEVFKEFSVSQSGVLLCTDVAARGLHLPAFTPPTAAAEYVHRVGRTARIGGRGSSLLFLTPAETAFTTELANHNISLSEMKLEDILSSLMMDDTFKGRGRYHSQETRERATVLQTEFENFVHSDAQSLQNAKKALQSFLRSYTTFPAPLKHIFHIKHLHLGHTAKSFGLRDAPQGLSAPGGAKSKKKGNQKNNQKRGGGLCQQGGESAEI
ncbi:hypothetical protein KUCAC02_035398, partial [Chaenocephalus aceratus]